eukprot:TRINITY_DN114_c7_g1_i1.p1 TRINITY_DN114_c7_g1~~TRINITY_DN114_c7_g1_i1.p1  ORF type:complete len:360 (+),score=71.10 TRINITY_DN114_c7_g1_i1:79-1080(+)
MTLFLRSLIAITLITMSLAESNVVVTKIGVQSTPNELNSKTKDRSLLNAVLTGLDSPGVWVCTKICDMKIENCDACGRLPQSTEKASYTIHFMGITNQTLEAVKAAMVQPMNDLFGSDNVVLIDVEEYVFSEPVYATINITTTLQQLVADKEFIVSEVDKVLKRTDSTCIEICDEEANICHKCSVDKSSATKNLIMVVWGSAKPDDDLNKFALALEVPLREKYPLVNLKTNVSLTYPQLPTSEPIVLPALDTLPPFTLPPHITLPPFTFAPFTVTVPNFHVSDDGLANGVIVLIAIGCIVVIALIIFAVYFFVCKKDTTKTSEEREMDAPNSV